jgi:hypothetical protein
MATIGKELAGAILERLGFAAGINIRSCIDRINEELENPPNEETKQLLEEYKEDFRTLMIQAHTIMGKLSADSEDPRIAQELIGISREICGGAR